MYMQPIITHLLVRLTVYLQILQTFYFGFQIFTCASNREKNEHIRISSLIFPHHSRNCPSAGFIYSLIFVCEASHREWFGSEKNAEIRNWNKSSEYSLPIGNSLSLAMMEIQIQVLRETVAANHKELIIKVAEKFSKGVINSSTEV